MRTKQRMEGSKGGWEIAGRSHLLGPLASHPDPGLSTVLSGGSCTLGLRDARGHLGLGGSCWHNILRLHPPSLGESLSGLGRLGPGGCPFPGWCRLGHPRGGSTGALWGSLLGRGGPLGAWKGHATDTCWLGEIKDIVLTQESCLGPGGIHLTSTWSLSESTGGTGALGSGLLGLGDWLGGG
uniref:Uncharacterized protein n=1 Tax=Mustela putorius furo TaxID=9669 RepID=M3XQS2_MUSPF